MQVTFTLRRQSCQLVHINDTDITPFRQVWYLDSRPEKPTLRTLRPDDALLTPTLQNTVPNHGTPRNQFNIQPIKILLVRNPSLNRKHTMSPIVQLLRP